MMKSVVKPDGLVLPAELLAILGDPVFVALAPDGQVALYAREKWEELSERVSALSERDQRAMDVFFASAFAYSPAEDGPEMPLPGLFLEYANLETGDPVTFRERSPGCWLVEKAG